MINCLINFKTIDDDLIYYGYYKSNEIEKLNNDFLNECLNEYKHTDWEEAKTIITKRYDNFKYDKERNFINADKFKSKLKWIEKQNDKYKIKLYNLAYFFKMYEDKTKDKTKK